MRIQRTTPRRSGATRRTSLLAAATGLTAAVALAAPSAAAEPPTTFSAAELATTSASVLKADVGGTAWHVDAKTNRLVVSVDSTVSKAEINRIKAQAGANAGALKIERMKGELKRYISGGDAIYGGGSRCSLGFNVRSGSTYYFLTAGHCTNLASTWTTSSGSTLGTRTGTSFPNNDYGIVRYAAGVSHPGTVGGQDITRAANPSVGQAVTRRGSTTGSDSGSVTGLNATVNYGGGDVVYGMIRTNVCAEPGDSGGPLYNGTTAYGLTSGGSGNCTVGGTTYYQPVVEVLNRYGVSVY